jgi:hypothetical protein
VAFIRREMMITPWTEKGTRAKCRRKLKAITRQVEGLAGDVAYEWGDVDQSIVEACDAMIDAIKTHARDIEDYMTERVADAEGGDDDAPDQEPIDASKNYVTITKISEVAGVSRKHVRRQVTRAQAGRAWCGADLRLIVPSKGEFSVEFSTLPEHIREAFVMLDQVALPLE